MATTPNYSAAGQGGSNYANVTIAGGSGAGLVYTAGTGVSSPVWTTSIAQPYYQKQPKVKITDTDIEIDGLSLKETMLAVKNELLIPTRLNRNDALEKEFHELQEAAERYKELELKFLEQKKMWETLKRTDQ
jgi:hypothetical protein